MLTRCRNIFARYSPCGNLIAVVGCSMQNDFLLQGPPLPSDQLGALILNPDSSTAGLHPDRRIWLALSRSHALTLMRLPIPERPKSLITEKNLPKSPKQNHKRCVTKSPNKRQQKSRNVAGVNQALRLDLKTYSVSVCHYSASA